MHMGEKKKTWINIQLIFMSKYRN